MKTIQIMCLVLCVGVLTGCVGETVPAGKIVIIVSADGKTQIIDKGVYRAYGRDRKYFVDGRFKSYKESMKILCADEVNMDVDAKALISFDVSEESIEFIKSKMPTKQVEGGELSGYELSLDEFYKMAVADVVRGTCRNIISVKSTDDIRPNRAALEADIQSAVIERVTALKYPVKVSAVLLSNIDYPESVKAKREEIKNVQLEEERKAALAQARLAEAERMVAVETEEAKVRLVRATAQAGEYKILGEQLTDQFLMWRQLEVLSEIATKLATSPSNTVFMMPYSTMNPDILNTVTLRNAIDQMKPTTPANN